MALSLEPGFLDFDNLPDTNFSCVGKVIGGYYADMDTNCQMFHVCTIGQLDEPMDIRFLCLNGTVFDQETRVCERIDEVDCSKSEQFYSLNLELYGNSPPSNLEETAETEQPLIIKSTSPTTTTSTTTTTSRPQPKIKTTRQQFFTTIVPTTTPKNAPPARPQVITTHHFPVLNPSPDIRFNPEEINISLRPGGAPPDIRQKETTQRNVVNYDRPTPSDVNYGFTFRQTEEVREDYTEAPDYHSGYRFREHRPGQGYLDHNPTRSRQQQQQQQHFPVVTTFRSAEHHKTSPPSPAAAAGSFYLQQSLKPPQPHHRSQYERPKPQSQPQQGLQRLQLPVPLPPQVSQFTFSTPAPFQHTDTKRYTKDHIPPPRIVISASASVSDDTGRRLNYSLGTIGTSQLLNDPSNSYEEYKDEEERLERFYHDVQKVKHSRRKRSTDQSVKHSDIIKNDQQAVQVLKFLFDWYRNEKTNPARQSTTPVSSPLDISTIQLINGELASTTEDSSIEIPDSFEDSDLFNIKSKYSIIGRALVPPEKDTKDKLKPKDDANQPKRNDELYLHDHGTLPQEKDIKIKPRSKDELFKYEDPPKSKQKTKDELYQHEHDYVDDNYEPVAYQEKKEQTEDNEKDKKSDKEIVHELVTNNENQKNHSVLLDYVDDNIEPIYYRERQDDNMTEKSKHPSKKDTVDASSHFVSTTYSVLDDTYYKHSLKENEDGKLKETMLEPSNTNESTLDKLYYISNDTQELSTKYPLSQYESSTHTVPHQEIEQGSTPVQETAVDPASHYESSTYSALDRLFYLHRQNEEKPEQTKKDISENDWTHYESSTRSTLEQLLAVNLQNKYDENSQTTTTESVPSTNFNIVTEETTIPVTDPQTIENASQNSSVDDSISSNFINRNSNLSQITISDTSSSSTSTEKPALVLPKRNQRRGRRRYHTNEKNNKDVEFKNLLIEKLIERPYRAKDDYDYLRTVSNVYSTTLRTEDSLQDDEKQPTVLPTTEDTVTATSEANTLNELFDPNSSNTVTTSPSTSTTTETTSTSTTETPVSHSSSVTPTLTSIITEAPRTKSSRRRGRHRFTITEASTTPRNKRRRRPTTLEPRATTEASSTTQSLEQARHESGETERPGGISFAAIQRLFDINGDAQDSPIEPASEVAASTTERYQDLGSTSSSIASNQISPTVNELNLEALGTPNFPVTESTVDLSKDKAPPVEIYLTSFNPTTEATHVTKKKQLREEPTTPSTEWTSLEKFISNIETNTRSVATDKEKIHRALGELNEGETGQSAGEVRDVFSVNLLPKVESAEQSTTTPNVEVTTSTVLYETTTEKFKYFYEMIPRILENVADDRKTTYFGEMSTTPEAAVSSTESNIKHDIVETTTENEHVQIGDTTTASVNNYTDSEASSQKDASQEGGHKIILGIIMASAEPDSTTPDAENTTSTYYEETTTPTEAPMTRIDTSTTQKPYIVDLDTSTVPPTPRIVVQLGTTHDDSKPSDTFFKMDNFWEHLHTPVDFSPHSSTYADRFGHNHLDQNAKASFPTGKVSHSNDGIRQIADEIANLTKSVLDLTSLTDTSPSMQSTTSEVKSSQIPTTLDFTTQPPSTSTLEATTEYSLRRNGRRRGQRPTNGRRNPESYQRHRHRFQTESFTSRPETHHTIEDDIVDLVAKSATETTLEPTRQRTRPPTSGGDFSTDAPLKKSAVPTQAERGGDLTLPTTPLSETKMAARKHYFFNCFGKPIDKFYADPRDCRLFHYCTQGYSKNQLLDMKFVCDLNTYYDDEKLICTKNKPARCL
ncbi:unnamed protein product [Acanthoscelides obtectus]|uniref:Chitin-binding type-2 domain-containing protein n=1 Tax=Acanthoscelides obtectus TaxID=200917 RepID=A0A9P0PM69_ACAOB|nr:unnamed protein product [Acanthoscelides obtectus]CAK1626568.1 hypothetical protein AOBTE_LOCUS3938 [Acanthoscelides obtectus]